MDKIIPISASNLSAFMSCPGKTTLSNKWKRIEEVDCFKDGSDAHKMMEIGEVIPDASVTALAYHEQLVAAEKKLGYSPIRREGFEKFDYTLPSGRVVQIRRVIDLYARMPDGSPVIIDYKTASRPWETVDGETAPQAQGFQGSIYLIPSPTSPFVGEEGQVSLAFLVATQASWKAHWHDPSSGSLRDLTDAMEIYAEAVEEGRLPFVRGYSCGKCEFKELCYKVPGYQYQFQTKY